ncbi:MAG: hypothetical protein D6714_10280, partial [Bacteroidetes bacterium]
TLFPDTLTCTKASLTLSVNTNLAGGIYAWQGPGGFMSSEPNPVISAGGLYTLTLTDANGCPKTDAVFIATDTLSPVLSVSGGTISCVKSEIELTATSPTVGLLYNWYDENGLFATGAQVSVSAPGNYQVEAVAPNGCLATAVAEVAADLTPPDLSASGGALTCDHPTLALAAQSGTAGVLFLWQGPNGFESDSPNPIVSLAGQYVLKGTAPNGCVDSVTVEVTADFEAPHLQITAPEALSCARETVILDATNSDSGFDFVFFWETNDGHFSEPPTTLAPAVDQPGHYFLTIINTKNGCTASAGMEVEYDETGLAGATWSLRPPTCHGDRDGEIKIDAVTGGTPPYLYKMDGGDFGASPLFTGLSGGKHSLEIEDVNGCRLSTEIELPEGTIVLFSLTGDPADRVIQLGDSIAFHLEVNLAPDELDHIVWSPLPENCEACPDPVFKPLETTAYSLEIAAKNGCLVQTDFLVRVLRERPVFVPNAFSPNGDGVNDRLTVYGGPAVRQILRFVVFDRWGAVMFSKTGLPSGNEMAGWDGETGHQAAAPGIYSWMAEVEYIDGAKEVLSGDVMLIR